MRKLVTELLRGIFESGSNCPSYVHQEKGGRGDRVRVNYTSSTVKEFLFYMRSEIRDKYCATESESTVRSFFFLRFVCPTIVNPKENGAINSMLTLFLFTIHFFNIQCRVPK